MSDKRTLSFKKLGEALARLEDALKEPITNKLAIDGTIQRFEFCFELSWKLMRVVLITIGIEVDGPRPTLRKAYATKFFDDEALWIKMMEDRNKTSHIYEEQDAREIYERIKIYAPEMRRTYLYLKEQYAE